MSMISIKSLINFDAVHKLFTAVDVVRAGDDDDSLVWHFINEVCRPGLDAHDHAEWVYAYSFQYLSQVLPNRAGYWLYIGQLMQNDHEL